jgi:predicted transposase YdaD
LRLALTVWIQQVVLPTLAPGVRFPAVRDLREVKQMLGKDIVPWTERWKQEGIQAGIQLGIEEGFEKGIEKGRLEGIERGMAVQARKQLRRLLTRRFGPLPEWVEERLDAAEIAQLEEWADRILDAETLKGVFEDT